MEIILLIILLVGAWFWMDSVSKRETAIKFGKDLAQRFSLQLLDESVACTKITLKRDDDGRVQLLRIYDFEVTARGNERMPCQVHLLSKHLHYWHIPPYLQTNQ